jgi:hypothetical protein
MGVKGLEKISKETNCKIIYFILILGLANFQKSLRSGSYFGINLRILPNGFKNYYP